MTTATIGSRRVAEFDGVLLWVVAALLGLGLVMVYSASIATAGAARHTGYDGEYYLVRQALYIAAGVVAAALAFRVPTHGWQQIALPLGLAGLALLMLVLVPGVGREVNGSTRWIPLGFGNLQPAELMKLAVVLYAADYTARKAAEMHSFVRGFLPMALALALTGVLLLAQPDLGALVVIVAIAMAVLFVGGLNWRLFAGLFVALVGLFVLLVFTAEYRLKRITSYMDPFADPFGAGYQLSHALIAFGRGELTGLGLGNGIAKQFYLPEAHTDFLLAVIAEELGYVGVLAVVGLFALLVWRAFQIGRRAEFLNRPFAALTAFGIGIWLGGQAFINMGVNTGLLPTKGLTLPFMSFGGSGIIANCVAIGILVRIDWEHRQMMRGRHL